MAATRKQVRQQLVTLMTASGAFDAVYGYAPLDLRCQDKILCIYSDNSRHEMLSAHLNNAFYRLFLEVYVRRRLDDEGAEDTLDDLHETIRGVIRTNVGDATWNELDLEQASDALFAKIAGEPYRVERHTILVKVTSS